jgi:uncharacterized protein with NRDE domain
MCTLAIRYAPGTAHPLLIAANRDEFLARDTRPLHWWDDRPEILGGRDGAAGGTWFGVHRKGRFATLTNVRAFPLKSEAPSRGALVTRWLEGDESAEAFGQALDREGDAYNGYNLIYGTIDPEHPKLWYQSNHGRSAAPLPEGLHGLSNALLNSPWPKVEAVRKRFEGVFAEPAKTSPEAVFEALKDKQRYPDEALPDTGVGLERERGLSALFIELPGYATRASWFLRCSAKGNVDVHERSYHPQAEASIRFAL